MDESIDEWMIRIVESVVVPIFLVVTVFFLVREMLLTAGYPFGGEIFSNLLPALHARTDVAAGRLPIRAELFFTGRYQFSNPLWYGFYPPAWILFVPSIPLEVAVKILIVSHLAAVPLVAYHFGRRRHQWPAAAVLALLWLLPLASQVSAGHLEKILSWPWFTLAAWQLFPERIRSDRKRSGLVAGISVGTILLAGGNYYFAYAMLLVAPIVILSGARQFAKRFTLGLVVGLPHLVSVVPAILNSGTRPSPGYGLWPHELLQLTLGILDVGPFGTPPAVTTAGYGVVGIGVIPIALYGLYKSLETDIRWATGLSITSCVALLFIGEIIYLFPVVDILRVASRATILLAAVALLLTSYGARVAAPSDGPPIKKVVVVCLLLLSAVHAGWLWGATFDYDATEPTEAERVADRLLKADCDSVWLSGTPSWGSTEVGLGTSKLGFSLTERGIALRAVHYGRIGQEWVVRGEDGKLTFDSLVSPIPLPTTGNVTLTSSDRRTRSVGVVNVSEFQLIDTVQFDGKTVYLYGVSGRCS